MPPAGLYLMVLVGLIMRWRARRPLLRRLATILAASGALLSVALSLPLVSYLLLDGLQRTPSLDPAVESIDADVIVVLAGDVDCDPPEYGSDQPGPLSQLRCRYGARLSRQTGLPLVITGGVLRPDRRPVSHVLRDYVENELGVEVAWTEDDARTTRGNARGRGPLDERERLRPRCRGDERLAHAEVCGGLRARRGRRAPGSHRRPRRAQPPLPRPHPSGSNPCATPRGHSTSTWACSGTESPTDRPPDLQLASPAPEKAARRNPRGGSL